MLPVCIYILAIFLPIQGENVCKITVPIGQWLQNNTGPCDMVKGNFILDETADNFTDEVFSTFGGLKSIDGCLYVKGFNGSNNLSFFGNLEEVVCQEEQATASNLKDVFYVMGPFLQTMGFNSLKKVEGPGKIVLSYDEVQKSYARFSWRLLPEGVQCFSKKEMLFLARHLQFNGKMYQPCETDDPCFTLDHFHRYESDGIPYWYYRFAEIPENCTTFVGVICIVGPYEYTKELFDKFMNLTLLIGQIHIAGTFLNNLDTIFPNLQNIYPYELPYIHIDWKLLTCNDETIPNLVTGLSSRITERKEALQIVRVRLNRFLTNFSLPSLLPTRPLDLSNPVVGGVVPPTWFYYPTFFPEPVPSPCQQFTQFEPENCGRFINNRLYPGEIDSQAPPDGYEYFVWLVAMVSTAIGVVFTLRTIILLEFSKATTCLPYSRYFLIFAILISTLAALESSIIYQKFYEINDFDRYVLQVLSQFDSPYLTHPLFQFVMTFLVSSKHTCLVLMIFSYVDLVLFYRTNMLRISLYFVLLATVFAVILCIYLHSQLFIAIRGVKPNYSKEPRHVVYMPFIMNAVSTADFSKSVPSTTYIPVLEGQLDFSYSGNYFYFNSTTLDIHGNTFPTFVAISDGIMILVSVIFHSMASLGAIRPHNTFIILILLYAQLSGNRIRHYVYDILVNDYCRRKDTWTIDDLIMSNQMGFNCYSPFRHDTNTGLIMEEYVWKILAKFLEKLPYLTFPIVSLYCWKFARYESYLGPALRYRENQKVTKKSEAYDPADPSDIRL